MAACKIEAPVSQPTVSAVSDKKFDIYTFNMDTLTETKHTSAVDNQINMGPKWSPDGNKIVFSSSRAGTYVLRESGSSTVLTNQIPDIWVINVDGSGLTRLTHQHYNDPLVSQAQMPFHFYTMKTDGTEQWKNIIYLELLYESFERETG